MGHTVDSRGARQDLFVQTNDISVVSATSRSLILRVCTPWIKFLVICGHAPHTGRDTDEISSWWTGLQADIPQSMVHFPCVLLVDANARVGDTTCSHIGDFAGESGCEKSEPFTSFLRARDIWLPCTFDCHQGPSGTWRHHAGHWTRNDYVGLPASWQVQQCTSWTATDIDLTLQHEDHRVALVKFSMPICQKFHDRTPPPFKRSAVTADLKELRWSPDRHSRYGCSFTCSLDPEPSC